MDHIGESQLRAWLDQEAQRVAQHIRVSGVHIEYVIDDAPAQQTSLAYTVGLFGIAHPELLVLGLSPASASSLLNEVARRVREGDQLVPGELLTFETWSRRVLVEESPNPGEIVFAANAHYQRPAQASVPVLQLTYDDVAGRFPWDVGYDRDAWIQPRPGTFTA